MFFTKPNINFDQGWYKEPAAPDNPATAGEVFDTAWDASNRSELFGSSSRNLIDTYDAHNKRVEEITGKKFSNPASGTFFEFETDDERTQFYKDFGSYTADGGSLGERGYAYQWKEQAYRHKLADLAEQFPDYRDQLLPETTFKERASGMARDSAAKAESAMERSGGGVLPQLSSLGGSAMSGLTDPINIVTAPFGFGGVGTGLKGLAMGFLKTGASNAAVEAAVQPFVQADRSAAGMESGAAMGAANVGMAFAFGGALDLGIRGTARGLRWSLGYEPVVDAKGVVIGYKKIAPSQPVDPAAPAKAADSDPSFISKDLIDKADAEDPAAMRAVAEKSGLINEPLVRSTFDAMDANERMVGSRPSETIADGEHAKGIVQTLRHVNEPELEPMPVVRDGTTLDTIRALDLDMAEVRAEIRLLKERAPDDADGLARLEARVTELRVSKFDAQREIMADDLIQAVDQGRMPQELADLVVDHVADKAIQGRVASDLAKMRPTSPTEARHRLAQILSSPDYRPEVPAVPARGNGLARPALDDPYGADAKAQVVALEKEMAQELDAAGVKREGAVAEGKAKGDGKDGKPAPEIEAATKIGKAIGDAFEAARKVAPAGTEFRTFSKVSDLPSHLQDAVAKANAEVDAMFDPVSKAVYLSTAAIDPAGRLHHESVHALKAAGLLTDGEIRLLAERAAKLDDLPFDRAKYEAAYRDRYSEDGLKLALDEEAAAHLVEARSRGIDFGAEINAIADRILQFFERLRNALDGLGFKTADDVIDAILSGEVARRQAIQSVMEAEDLTAVAVRPQPMYSIGKDPGLTDRVRSLIDWAFGLDKMPATSDELLKVAREATGLEQEVGRMRAELAGGDMMQRAANDGGELDAYEIAVLNKTLRGSQASSLGVVEGGVSTEGKAKKFFDVGFKKSDGGSVSLTSAYEHYAAWAETTGAEIVSLPTFSRMISDQGFTKQRIGGRVRLIGIELNNDALPSNTMFAFAGDGVQKSEPLFAMAQDTETGRSMRRDLDQLGYFSGALEAAKGLKQAKGTPEQMLAQLKAGGAKQAELEATGLLKWIEEKSGSRESGADAGSGAAIGAPSRDGVDGVLDAIAKLKRAQASNEDDRLSRALEANVVNARHAARMEWERTRQAVDPAVAEAETGNPITVQGYHGSNRVIEGGVFRGSGDRRFNDLPGTWFATERFVASEYVHGAGSLHAADVHLANPVVMDAGGSSLMSIDDLRQRQREWQEAGHDGLIVRGINDFDLQPHTQIWVWNAGSITGTSVVGPNGERTSGASGRADRLKQPSISKSEIIEFLEKNRVGVKEAEYSRSAAFEGKVKERIADWREEQLAAGRFEPLRRHRDGEFYDSKALPQAVEWLEKNGVVIDLDLLDSDPIAAFAAAGAKVTPGKIGMWSENNGNFYIVEHPDGRAVSLSDFDSWADESASKADAIEALESLAGRDVRDNRLAYQSEYERELRKTLDEPDPTKWSSYSLDPSNPTYRETVIHLPVEMPDSAVAQSRVDALRAAVNEPGISFDEMLSRRRAADAAAAEMSAASSAALKARQTAFQSGHFPEPNIVGHMMTSMTKHEGKPVYTIDQIQSDWGQKIESGTREALSQRLFQKPFKQLTPDERKSVSAAKQDGDKPAGVRDEKKIASIRDQLRQAADMPKELAAKGVEQVRVVDDAVEGANIVVRGDNLAARINRDTGTIISTTKGNEFKGKPASALLGDEASRILFEQAAMLSGKAADVDRLIAELRTAEASSPGNPLVNTTDQWTNTTLRRALRQAAEADAEYIAVPSGKTVLSYNPGDEHGMEGFYDKIVPKNLRNLIQKLDKDAPAPARIDQLETPTSGMKGNGFALFELTERVKSKVLAEGQPLFAMRNDGRKTPGSDARKQYVKEDFDAIDAQFQKAGGDERLKLQAKRAALLNAKAHEKVSSDVMNHLDLGNQTDPGKAMMMVVENQGQATFQGLTTIRDIAIQTDLGEMGKMMWEMRKGAVLGDKRRNTAPVKTMLHNVIREAWGKDSGDATAKQFAQAYLASIEKRRQRWNHAGGDIKKLEGYAGPQYHDPEAWAVAGREEIVKYFTQDGVLDRSRMISFDTGAPMTDAELSDMMKGIWRNVVTEGAAAFEEGASAGAGRPGAKYKQRMEHRVLHFKDADAWLAYNDKYGSGDVYASIVGEAITMNRDIALMERLGANPLLTWERLKADIVREAQNAVAAKSLYDEFMDKIESLRAKRQAIPNTFETLRQKMATDMETIDQLKDESKTSKRKAFRNRPKISALTQGLRETVLAIETALKDGAETQEQLAITNEIGDLMAEMVDAGASNSMSRNPLERTQRLLKRADEMMKSYMGATNVPADDRLAAGMTATRNLLGASTLIYASYSALNDQMTQAMARLLTGLPLKSQISSYVKAFTKMDRQFALDTAIGLESVLPAVHESNRFVGSINARHISGYVADRSHAFSFLSPMTTAAKIAFSLDFMKDFAGLRGTDFAELPEQKQRLFERHGITPADWEAIRKAEPEQHRGREHLTHRAIAKVAGYEVADKYLGMLYRERSYSTVEGLVRGRTAFISDTQSGSSQGEALRSMAMFKGFPVSYGILIFGRLYEEVMKGRAMQPSVIGAAASIFIGGTILGALVIQLKQIAQGKDPRDMTDPKFWAQAFMQSGGLGIYGDFVASSINRQGSGLAGTIAGPVADLGGNVLDLTFGNIAQYASDEKTNAGREAVKLMRRLTPGMIAPWYIRTAVDRMVFDELQKVLDPEAHRSFQSLMRTTKKVGGNDFFWAPGTSEPQRTPNMGAIFGR